MHHIKTIAVFLLVSAFTNAQEFNTKWYSETTVNDVTIQNSYPKGGLYKAPVADGFNHSYLVFYTRMINNSSNSIDIKIDFSGDSIPIPNSPNTYLKLFLPKDKMTPEKQSAFSYGVTELESLHEPTSFQKTLKDQDECLFYVVAFFYQTNVYAEEEDKGGNRGEFYLDGQTLYYRMLPQIEALPCGTIVFDE